MPAIDSNFIDAFFRTEDFAVAATYHPVGGGAAPINVLPANEDESSQLIGTTRIDGRDIIVIAKESDIIGNWNNARINVNSINYYIKEYESDGNGFVLLRISKDSK